MEHMVKIYDDRPTVLMADDASLSGRFGVWRERRKVKRFHVTGFTSPNDTMEWVVDSPVNGL